MKQSIVRPTLVAAALLSVSLCVVVASCGGHDDDTSLVLPFNMDHQAEVVEGYTCRLSIFMGNGNYDIRVADPSVVSAKFVPPFGGIDYGSVVLTGLKRGVTTVSVSDPQADHTVDVSVRVLSPNFYMMSMVNSNHKALERDVVSCFVPSEKPERDVLFFRSDGIGLLYLTRGTYHTETTADDMTLVMSYPCSRTDSTFLFTQNAVMMEHRFSLKGSSSAAQAILSATGPLDDEQTRQMAGVRLAELGTAYRMEANMVYGPNYTLIIPFGYLE